MESQSTSTTVVKYYDHKLSSDKHYFGGYLNLAMNNYTMIANLFEEKFKESLENFLQENRKISYAQWEKMLGFLKQHFPVIHYIDLPAKEVTKDNPKPFPANDTERRKHFITTFSSFIKLLSNLRNFYSHYYHQPLKIKVETLSILDHIFVAVCNEVKSKRMKTDETKLLLKEKLADELKLLFDLKKKELLELKAKVGIPGRTSDEEVHNAMFNDSFKHLFYEKQPTQFYKSALPNDSRAENGISISQTGLSLVLSFFLSKREMEDYKSRLAGLKGKILDPEKNTIDLRKNSLRFMATHWVFSYLCFKGPHQKLNTSYLEETLLVQIIDELTKVPHEVYQSLNFDQRSKFVEDINEFLRQDIEEGTEENALVVHPVIRKRYENKFNYFALRYLDEFAGFPSLRFQVYAGNYLHDRRPKELKSGAFVTDREVKEKIYVFGRLSAVTALKDNFFRSDISLGSNWERFPNPSYNINGNNIAIYLHMGKGSSQEVYDTHSAIISARHKRNLKENREGRKNNKPTKDDIFSKLRRSSKSDVHRKEPIALLSLHELPALLYELLVNKVTPDKIEAVLADRIATRFRILNEYTTQSNLSHSQIPKNLKASLPDEQVNFTKLIRQIDNLIAVGENKSALITKNLSEVKSPSNKRKFVFNISERGREATWLAADIKRFMPESAKDQWKGYHHTQLQEILAFYFARKQDALSLLNSVWNLRQSEFGAALEKLFLKEGFDSFYEAYLKHRKEYLYLIKENIVQYNGESKVIKKILKSIEHIFPKKSYTIRSTQDQIQNLLGKPIAFPRGIFDSKPTFITGITFEGNEHLFADWYRSSKDKGIAFQSFYNLPRDYSELITSAKAVATETGRSITDFPAKVKMDTDIQITHIKTQDFFLKLIADALYEKSFAETSARGTGNILADFSLEQLYLERENRITIQHNAKMQYQREPGTVSKNVYNDSFIWNTPVSFQAGQIQEPQIKLKDIGKLKRFIADTRITELFAYAPARIWSVNELEEEINLKAKSYETIRREQILKNLFEFEKNILTSLNFDGKEEPAALKNHVDSKFRAYVAEGILRAKGYDEAANWLMHIHIEKTNTKDLINTNTLSADAFLLVLIRNKFMHNQLPSLPYYEFMLERYPKKQDETFSEYFLGVATNIMSKLAELKVNAAVG
ncbi:type VI-B CRISPR-associated RNA-guided ribonuclease Cas13b [Niabella sp. 22666]|uniref:type VI-B CRISPR-associated RNA-guided ribonuclease Cas13b n=1 Tax=Niabella sp. 22666 TaxID=3453954 RepID=UPI003F826559